MEYKTLIESLDGIIDSYYAAEWDDARMINSMAKDLSTVMYRLEKIRSDIHKDFQIEKKAVMDTGASAAKGETLAHIKYPSMYELRHVMKGAYECLGLMKQNIMYKQSEMKLVPS